MPTEACPSGQFWGQSLAHIFSAHPGALAPRAAFLLPNTQDSGALLRRAAKRQQNPWQGGEVLKDHTTLSHSPESETHLTISH